MTTDSYKYLTPACHIYIEIRQKLVTPRIPKAEHWGVTVGKRETERSKVKDGQGRFQTFSQPLILLFTACKDKSPAFTAARLVSWACQNSADGSLVIQKDAA